MKFGEQFKYYKVPEYSDNYLDYELLKGILKSILIQYLTSILFNTYKSSFFKISINIATADSNGQSKSPLSLIDPFIRSNSLSIKKKKVNNIDLSESLLKISPSYPVIESKKKPIVEDIKNENIINENFNNSDKSVIQYFYKENDKNTDSLYEFGSQIKDDEEIFNFSDFIKEYRKQTKNVDHFYRNQLKINQVKFEKILNNIRLKNYSSSVIKMN